MRETFEIQKALALGPTHFHSQTGESAAHLLSLALATLRLLSPCTLLKETKP